MQEDAVAREVFEETDTEAGAIGGALNQARDIGHDETAMSIDLDHPQIRHQRSEGIIGDLRPRRRHRPDQGRLARIWQPQQADIRQHFQFKLQRALFAFRSRAGLSRRPVGAGFVARVTEAVPTALGHNKPVTMGRQVAEHLGAVLINDRGAHGYPKNEVLAALAGTVAAAAGLAILGAITAHKTVVDHGVEVFVGFQDDTTAITAIAAIRAAPRNILLPAEAQAAVATVARKHLDACFIYKFHGSAVAPLGGVAFATANISHSKKKAPSVDEAFYLSGQVDRPIRRSPPARISGCWGPGSQIPLCLLPLQKACGHGRNAHWRRGENECRAGGSGCCLPAPAGHQNA